MLTPSRLKQYKTRIKSWGLDKKLKKKEVEFMLRQKRQREAAGKKSAFRIRGQRLDEARVIKYQKRTQGVVNGVPSRSTSPVLSTHSDISCYTPAAFSPSGAGNCIESSQGDGVAYLLDDTNSPPQSTTTATLTFEAQDRDFLLQVPQRAFMQTKTSVPASTVPTAPSPPTLYLISEKIFTLTTDYVKSCPPTGPWRPNSQLCQSLRRYAKDNRRWPQLITDADILLRARKADKAGELLQDAFLEVELLIKSEDASLMSGLLWLLHKAMELFSGPEIIRILLKHMYWMARALLGVNHPFEMISFSFLFLDDWDTVSEIAQQIVCDVSEATFGPEDDFAILRRVYLAQCYSRRKKWIAAEAQYRRCVRSIEAKLDLDPLYLCSSLEGLSGALYNLGNFAEAEEVALRIVRLTDEQCTDPQNMRWRVKGFWRLSDIHKELGHSHLAEGSMREAYHQANTHLGPEDALTVLCMSALSEQQWYRLYQ